MAVAPRVSIEKVSEAIASGVAAHDAVTDAWVSVGPDAYEVWLLVRPIDLTAERELCAVVDPLYARFPSTTFNLHILNPETFVDLRPESIVPAQARRIPIRSPR